MGKVLALLGLIGPGLMLLGGTGCNGSRPPRPTGNTDGRPTYEHVVLTIVCPDAALADRLRPLAAGWAARTRATVSIEPAADRADVVVLSPAAFGARAAGGDFLPVPDALKQAGHAIQWTGLNAERTAAWAGQVRGIPLGAGGDVLLYRTDAVWHGRPLTPAATWEEFLDQAESLARDNPGKPVLAPLPADDDALLHLFHLIAADYDRQVVQGQAGVVPGAVIRQSTEFHHELIKGEPRLRAESFVAALTLLKRLQSYRPATGDVAAAVRSGQAKLAVVSLAELGRIAAAFDGRIPDAFAVAPVPGTRQCLDPATQKLAPAKNGVNLSAYLGDAGFVIAVLRSCPNPAAAFDLAADLAGPTAGLKLVADPALGFGPWRREQADPTRRDVWNGYGLNPTQMAKLIAAVQLPYAGSIANPVLAPRGPDAADLMAALARHVRECLTGATTPEAALASAEEEWKRIDAKYNPADLLKWRREAAGLSATD
jgi:ABC-type glycerol-3-phosphate transport system substrate-binding protein